MRWQWRDVAGSVGFMGVVEAKRPSKHVDQGDREGVGRKRRVFEWQGLDRGNLTLIGDGEECSGGSVSI